VAREETAKQDRDVNRWKDLATAEVSSSVDHSTNRDFIRHVRLNKLRSCTLLPQQPGNPFPCHCITICQKHRSSLGDKQLSGCLCDSMCCPRDHTRLTNQAPGRHSERRWPQKRRSRGCCR
jgi:hypothetical protein